MAGVGSLLWERRESYDESLQKYPGASSGSLLANVYVETPEAGGRSTQEMKLTIFVINGAVSGGSKSVCLGDEVKLDLGSILSGSAYVCVC